MFRRILCVLIALFLALPLAARAEPTSDLIRLHVIADDDTEAAQAFKLEIRDAVLAASQPLLAECATADEAWTCVQAHLEDFLAAAVVRAEELGVEVKFSAQAGIFEFPERVYGDTVVPAGDYRALRIIIGSGQGQNWWCVLFPSLCMTVEGGYRSILADWLIDCFGGDRP